MSGASRGAEDLKGLVTKQGTYASRLDFSTYRTGESRKVVPLPQINLKKDKIKHSFEMFEAETI